jgi:nucleoid DNA-binding protein
MSTAAKASVGKRELVALVKEKTGLSKEQAEAAVNTVLYTVVGTVAKGEGCGG